MTKRFTLRIDRAQIDALCGVAKEGGPTRFKPRFNIAPSQLTPVVRRDSDGNAEVAAMQWGLIPFWATSSEYGEKAYNAAADDLIDSPAFKYAFRRRRCLVPADGYFEWRDEKGVLQPYHFCLQGGEPFCFAGLWESWRPRQGSADVVETFAIVTTVPNEAMRPFRLQMPVILDPALYATWLNPDPQKLETALSTLKAYPSNRMSWFRVSPFVNDPEYDAPECVVPLEDPEPKTPEQVSPAAKVGEAVEDTE